MRIIAGRLGSRNFEAPRGHRTHPMSEKARGGVFAALGDIQGLSVIDFYAGSGALGFEAISRGAASAVLVELDKPAAQAIASNIEALGLQEQVTLTKADVKAWSTRHPDARFDVVMLDPPYDAVSVLLIQKLVKHAAKDGTVVLSWPSMLEVPEFVGCKLLKSATYGDATVHFYRRLD